MQVATRSGKRTGWTAVLAVALIGLTGCSKAEPPHTKEREVYDAIVAAEKEQHSRDLYLEKAKTVGGAGTPAEMAPEQKLLFASNVCKKGATPEGADRELEELYRTMDLPTVKVVLAYGVPAMCPENVGHVKTAALAQAERAEASAVAT